MALFMCMDVLYYCLQPYPNIPQARPVSLKELVRCADFISLHVPYDDGTKHILGVEDAVVQIATEFAARNLSCAATERG